MKKIKDLIKNKVNENLETLNEKKWYIVRTKQDAIYSVAIMAAIGTLDRSNRAMIGTPKGDDLLNKDIVWLFNMDLAQKTAFERVARDYIISIKEAV